MKKIMLSAIIQPSDDSVTLEKIKETLSGLGVAHFTFDAEVELADARDLTKSVWVYVQADDSEPLLKVAECGETDGDELGQDELTELFQAGVCTEFRAEYPRADKYGAPSYANEDDFAAGLVGYHGFKVATKGFEVHAEDRGDDGSEEIWLKIALPATPQDRKVHRSDNDMAARQAEASAVFERYKFGADDCDDGNVTVVDHDNWSMDDKNDFTKVVYVRYRDDPADADSHKISFHVRFNQAGEVEDAYALETEHGNDIGCRGDIHPGAPATA